MQNKEKINIFMDWIYNKPIHSNRITRYFYDRKFQSFIEMARKDVPDFITLCHIVNFIRLLKITYFYRFDKDDFFNIIDDITINENNFGFILAKNDYHIEIKLSKLDKHISIRIIDTLESKSHSELTKVEFEEGQLKLESPIQKLQYTYLNRLIMDTVCNILEYYYDEHMEDMYNGL